MMKKIPVRKCMGCNEQKSKSDLVRIVRSPEGEISVDATGKKNGRGAYICKDVKCLARVRKSKRLDKLFGVPVEDGIYDALEKELGGIE